MIWKNTSRLLSRNRSILTNRQHQQRWLRIACASGFWGDTAVSTPQLIHSKPKVDYVVYDYLSEITMSILAAMKAKNPAMGYAPDFLLVHMKPYLKALKENNVKIISNAGGLNPLACAAELRKLCDAAGVELKVAAITGDDLLSVENSKQLLSNANLKQIVGDGRLASVNAYFGAQPISAALDEGADVVITGVFGRCVDSALVLGPLMHERKWKTNDLDKMALGSLAGHIIECGAQATGGISTDWAKIKRWEQIGFPIVEFDDAEPNSNSFVVTKPPKTGGAVNLATVSEQICYEIDDPKNYKLPDCVVDMSGIKLEQIKDDRVRVSNVHGRPAPASFKVTATYTAGYRCTAVAPVIGPRAVQKARVTADAILRRCEGIFKSLGLSSFTRTHLHLIGSGQSYGASNVDENAREVMMWLAAEHSDKNALGFFAREIAPAGTGMAPGLTTLVGGRPNISPVLKHCSFPVDRAECEAHIHIDGRHVRSITDQVTAADGNDGLDVADPTVQVCSGNVPAIGNHQLTCLVDLAHTRSGDKGDTCNIGVIVRDPTHYEHLYHWLTADVVAEYFGHYLQDKLSVVRYELPGIHAFNFVLPNSLGGGGVASLRCDPQGKAYGQMLLDLKLPKP